LNAGGHAAGRTDPLNFRGHSRQTMESSIKCMFSDNGNVCNKIKKFKLMAAKIGFLYDAITT